MRILQVSAYSLGRYGGVQSHVRDLSQALRARGHEVQCLSPGVIGTAAPGIVQDFIEIGYQRAINLGGTKFELSYVPRRALLNLVESVAAWQPDLVHFHGLWVPVMPWQLFSKLQAARVVTFHDTTAPGATGRILRGIFRPLGRMIAARVDAAIAVSRAPMEHLGPAASKRPISILPPTIDLSDFLELSKLPMARRPVVMHWGRLDSRKNLGVLLQAARLIWRGYTGLAEWQCPSFVIAGDGSDIDLVHRAASELGRDAIRHLPPPDRQTLLSLLQEARLCVFPAGFGESFGIVVAESLASGTPVLAGKNAGFSSLLGPDGAGALFDSTDAHQLAQEITRLLNDQPLLEARGAWGRMHARQFDVSNQVESFERIYAASIASYRRSKPEGSGYQA